MLNCKEVTKLCSAEMERPLGAGETLALRLHLMMCSACTNFRKQMKLLRRTMHAYSTGEAPSTEQNSDKRD